MTTAFEFVFVFLDYFLGIKTAQIIYWFVNGKLPRRYIKNHPELQPMTIQQIGPPAWDKRLPSAYYYNYNNEAGDDINTYNYLQSPPRISTAEDETKTYMIMNSPIGAPTDFISYMNPFQMDLHAIPPHDSDLFRIPCNPDAPECKVEFRHPTRISSIEYKQTPNFR